MNRDLLVALAASLLLASLMGGLWGVEVANRRTPLTVEPVNAFASGTWRVEFVTTRDPPVVGPPVVETRLKLVQPLPTVPGGLHVMGWIHDGDRVAPMGPLKYVGDFVGYYNTTQDWSGLDRVSVTLEADSRVPTGVRSRPFVAFESPARVQQEEVMALSGRVNAGIVIDARLWLYGNEPQIRGTFGLEDWAGLDYALWLHGDGQPLRRLGTIASLQPEGPVAATGQRTHSFEAALPSGHEAYDGIAFTLEPAGKPLAGLGYLVATAYF